MAKCLPLSEEEISWHRTCVKSDKSIMFQECLAYAGCIGDLRELVGHLGAVALLLRAEPCYEEGCKPTLNAVFKECPSLIIFWVT